MEQSTAEALANRDEAMPVLSISPNERDASASEAESSSKRRSLRKIVSATEAKQKVQELGAARLKKIDALPGNPSIQDRLFTRLLQSVIPNEELDDAGEPVMDKRSSRYVSRPAFSLPLMTNNFRRFNARIGVVFVFQNRLIRLFTWRTPTHTVSFLAVYTFVCLDPYLLVAVPLAILLLFIMVPAFIARHPPPPPSSATSSTNPYYSYNGPAIAPARTIKPASETSKDFFRNMRDLQNSMADFANLHDAAVTYVAPQINFSDEVRSTRIFLYLFFFTVSLFVAANIFPWRFVFLVGGWTAITACHPTAQTYLLDVQKKAEKSASDLVSSDPDTSVLGVRLSALRNAFEAMSTITLDSGPETREVEIFELQHRPLSPPHEWTPYMFTPTPYDPLSPSRIAGDRPKGTRYFEHVLPPDGWAFESKKWELDLDAHDWVSERLVVGVEYDVNTLDGAAESGGWVWDLPPKEPANRDEEVWLAYGEYEPAPSERDKKKKPQHKKDLSRDWEEGVRWAERGKTGEWRRRRWVRVVRRVGIPEK